MSDRVHHVLFLCTGNSARSILAEALLNDLGAGRFVAHSAGSRPVGRVNPFAIELLQQRHLPTYGLRSKRWDEFAGPQAPRLDFVLTVCDAAAGEACPVWPGAPITAHWGLADPAAAGGSDENRRRAFADAWSLLESRVRAFIALPLEHLDRATLQARLRAIGAGSHEAERS